MWCGVFVEDEVAMNFVRNQNEIVALAELTELNHFVLGENAAEWVLRIAEDEEFAFWSDRLFKRVSIHDPTTVVVDVVDTL